MTITQARECGQSLFNAQRLTIDKVGGRPARPSHYRMARRRTVRRLPSGRCAARVNILNVGDHSTWLPINIGISEKAPARFGRERVADLPVFILRRKTDGAILHATYLVERLISGCFAQSPVQTGPSARRRPHPPFFHNGMART